MTLQTTIKHARAFLDHSRPLVAMGLINATAHCQLVLLIILTIILTIALPIILLGSIPLLLYRKLHEKCVNKYSNKYEILHPAGQTMIGDFLQENPIQNILCISVLEGHVSVQEIKQLIHEKWLDPVAGNPFPEVQKKAVCIGGFYYWMPIDDFKVDDYVQEVNVQDFQTANVFPSHACTEKDLKEIVAHLTSKNWRKDQSPWEFYVVHNFESDENLENSEAEKTVVIFRTHHFFVDGYSLLNLILSLLTGDKEMAAIPHFNGGNHFKRTAYRLFIWATSPYALAQRILKIGVDQNDWRVPMDRMSRKCYTTWSRGVSVEDLKLIKRKYGVSFQAVLHTLIGKAVGNLMEKAGQRVPTKIRAVVPIPLPNRPQGLKNYFTFACPTIPVLEPDPRKRISIAFKELKSAVISTAPIIAHTLQMYGGQFQDCITSRTIVANPGNTIAFTSFPAINGPSYFCGHKYLDIFGTIGTSIGNAGASLTALSSFGRVKFGITIDTGVYPSQDMLSEFDEMIHKEVEMLMEDVF